MHRTFGAKVVWRSISTFASFVYSFLGLEKECQREEWICRLPPNTLLPLLLDIICERWLFSDWLLDRLTAIVSSSKDVQSVTPAQLDARIYADTR